MRLLLKLGKCFMELEGLAEIRVSLDGLPEKHRKALKEYYYLAMMPELSEEQALKMQQILTLAEESDLISFLLNEIDELTFREFGFYEEAEETIENDIARVKEFVLFENEPMALSGSRHRECSGTSRGEHTAYPRVEMVFDAGAITRQKLGNSLNSAESRLIANNWESWHGYGHEAPYHSGTCSYNLLWEDPNALLAMLALGALVLLLIF